MTKIQYQATKSIGGGGTYIAMLKETLGSDQAFSSIASLALENHEGFNVQLDRALERNDHSKSNLKKEFVWSLYDRATVKEFLECIME